MGWSDGIVLAVVPKLPDPASLRVCGCCVVPVPAFGPVEWMLDSYHPYFVNV